MNAAEKILKAPPNAPRKETPWHQKPFNFVPTYGQVAEWVYNKDLASLLSGLPKGWRVLCVRPFELGEWYIPLSSDPEPVCAHFDGSAPRIIVERIPQPAQFEYVGPFEGGPVPDDHVVIRVVCEGTLTFGAGEDLEPASGIYDLYRVVRT